MLARGGRSPQRLTRRGLLLTGLALATAACAAPPPPPARPTVEPQWPPAWRDEAHVVLAEAGSVIAVWTRYADFRLGKGQAPTPTEWTDGTRRANDLVARATRFHETIATATINTDVWRERRALAAQSHRLIDLATAITAYRAEADRLSPGGDGSRALGLLDNARALLAQSTADWA